MRSVKIFGLSTCDTCRKARKTLESEGFNLEFQDVRQHPLTSDKLSRFLIFFGTQLVNTRATTWRGLGESERQLPEIELLTLHPTLMKRPVIQSDLGLTLGWNDDVRATHLG